MAATAQDSDPRESPSRMRKVPLLARGIIVAAGVAAYHNSFRIPFLFDDQGSIKDNTGLRSLWSALNPPAGGLPVSGRPFLNFSFAVNHALSGFDVWSYHAFNLAIHILAGLTLYAIVLRTIARKAGTRKIGKAENGLALVVALIWTLHPLQTESVDYISQRAESLMGLLYLLTLYFFIRGADDPKDFWVSRFPAFSIFTCFLGMATKEVMVSAPLIVLLYDRTFVAGTFGEAWRLRRKYYLGLACTWLVLICLVLGTGSRGGTAGFGIGLTPWDYSLIQFQAIVHYLRLAIWPHPLVFYYDRPTGVGAGVIAIDAVIVIGLVLATIYALSRPPGRGYGGRALGFAGAWFFAILAPSSSVVPVGTETIAEHRMYLPLAAVIVAVVCGIYFWVGRHAGRQGAMAWLFICMAVAAGMGFMTASRNEDYRSDLVLWSDTVAKTPNSSAAHNNLGSVLLQMGDAPAAIAECTEALRINPGNVRAHSNLADALVEMGRESEAIPQYEEALRLSPADAGIHNQLAMALAAAGELPEAIVHYESALRLNPGLAVTHNNLGNALVGLGRFPEAIDQFERALGLQPDYAVARDNLGAALAAAGRLPEAMTEYERALRLKPDFPEAENHLGNALAGMGRMADAGAHYEQALRLRPDFPEAHNNLGNVLLEMGKKTEAIAEYREALRLKPDYLAAHCSLGNLLAEAGQTAEAVEQFAAASRLQPGNAGIRNNLGCALAQLGRVEEARAQFEAALRLKPDYGEARANLEHLRGQQ